MRQQSGRAGWRSVQTQFSEWLLVHMTSAAALRFLTSYDLLLFGFYPKPQVHASVHPPFHSTLVRRRRREKTRGEKSQASIISKTRRLNMTRVPVCILVAKEGCASTRMAPNLPSRAVLKMYFRNRDLQDGAPRFPAHRQEGGGERKRGGKQRNKSCSSSSTGYSESELIPHINHDFMIWEDNQQQWPIYAVIRQNFTDLNANCRGLNPLEKDRNDQY